MAILHAGKSGGPRRRAVWGAIAAAIGGAAAWFFTGAGALQPAAPPAAVFRPRVIESVVTAITAAPGQTGPSTPAQPADPSPAQWQARARLYADCQAWDTRRVQGVVSELDESYAVDPSGALASAYRGVEQRRIEQCRAVGTAEYRQIEPLMQAAAQRGEPNARLFLIERQLRRLAERAGEARALGETDLTADAARAAQAEASLRELEQLALQGWRPAMQALADGLLAADPLRAAAWNLVASRALGEGGPLTMQDLQASGSLTALSADDSALVLSTAQQLSQTLGANAAPGIKAPTR